MSGFRSVGKFCSIVVTNLTSSNGDALGSLPASKLGDGAEAYCTLQQGVYRLNIGGGNTNLQPVYVPALGGGSWILQDSGGASSISVVGGTAMSSTPISCVVGTWHAMPSVASGYSTILSSPLWTLDATAGDLTFNGPTARAYLISAQFACSSAEATRPWGLQFAISSQAANLVGGTASVQYSSSGFAYQSDGGFGGGGISAANVIAMSISPGMIYRMAIKLVTSGVATSISVDRFLVNFTAL